MILNWIIYLYEQLDDTGMVKLPKLPEKVIQICQNIECLLPKTKSSLEQAHLSLTMHRKTSSIHVIQTLHKLGYGFHTRKLYLLKTNGQIGRNQVRQLYHQILKKAFQLLMSLII